MVALEAADLAPGAQLRVDVAGPGDEQAAPDARVLILEKSARFLDKVRISGGGRCNVTNACADPREFVAHYPRGSRAMIGALYRFPARETVAWFEARGVQFTTEPDGRLFPRSNTSETIIDCLLQSARKAGVEMRVNAGVASIARRTRGGFMVTLANGEALTADRVLLSTGGCRAAALGQLAVGLGHTLEPPVPSLFTFQIEAPWLHELAGIAVEDTEGCVPGTGLRERGPLMVTHWGLSGPAILRLSAWGARKLAALDYKFPLLVNWLPRLKPEDIAAEFQARREAQGAKILVNAPIAPLTARHWEALVLAAGLGRDRRWASLTRAEQQRLIQQLGRTEFAVVGKSLNKDEFVTCGGVPLPEVDFKTMESRVCPGLHFAGELLDIDGITGGFNFQAAWTTGYIAGRAMAQTGSLSSSAPPV